MFTINSNGDRYEVGFNIKAPNDTLAIEYAKQRANKEFDKVRSIVKFKLEKVIEPKKEYKNLITESSRMTLEDSTIDSNITNNNEDNNFIDIIKDIPSILLDKEIFKVVFTPGRKPRKRDYDKTFFIVDASTVEQARKMAKSEVESLGVPYKDKWANFYQMKLKDFLKEIENNYDEDKKAKLKKMLLEMKEDIKDDKDKDNEEDHSSDFIPMRSSMIDMGKDGNIKMITPTGLGVDLRPFKVVVEYGRSQASNFEVKAPDIVNASAYVYSTLKKDEFKNIYKDLEAITVIDPSLPIMNPNSMKRVDIKAFNEELKRHNLEEN